MFPIRWINLVTFCVVFLKVVHAGSISFKVSCRDLIPREEKNDDLPDAFVKIWYNGKDLTENDYLDQNQYPQWSDVFTVTYDDNDSKPIVIELRERDAFKIGDDEMGKISVHPKNLLKPVERVVWKDGNYVGKIRFHRV